MYEQSKPCFSLYLYGCAVPDALTDHQEVVVLEKAVLQCSGEKKDHSKDVTIGEKVAYSDVVAMVLSNIKL